MRRAWLRVDVYTPLSCRVPPRRRTLRSGYRPGQLSEELKAAIKNETEHLESIGDELELIEAVGNTFAALDDALEELALPRLKAIAELRRQGWSYDRLAAATPLSKGRIGQLAREARQRGL